MKPVICAAAAISLLAACAPGKLSRADEEDVSCLLADLAAFSTAQKADQGVQSPLTLALTQSALYRMGRLQGRHGDDDWPEVIPRLDPAVMNVRIYDKIQACSQSADFRNLMSNPKLKASLQQMSSASPPAAGQ